MQNTHKLEPAPHNQRKHFRREADSTDVLTFFVPQLGQLNILNHDKGLQKRLLKYIIGLFNQKSFDEISNLSRCREK